MHAEGTFDVKLTVPTADDGAHPEIARQLLNKVFQGDLQGTSRGEMLAARTPVPGSAGYVALERVEGALLGRRGSFALQHTGTMDRGRPRLEVTVVPDSGTGELQGLSGAMTIRIENGQHFYSFDLTLP